MKAIQINSYQGYEALELVNLSLPDLKASQVIVDVVASSINPFDSAIIKGFMKEVIPLKFPATMGGDFSGRVVKTSGDVTGVKAGDEVYGSAIILSGGSGAFAESAIINADRLAIKPKNVDHIKAASLPMVGVSSIQALIDNIKLSSGQKILIHGGAGGIGGIAIQLAKHLGAYVATTVSENDREYAKQLGADTVIDYKNEKFEELLSDYDAVFDTIGGEVMEKSFKVLKKGGILASMKGQPKPELANSFDVRGIAINTKIKTESLDKLTELVEKGAIKPYVDKVFPLSEIRQAFEYKDNNSVKGKIVIQIKDKTHEF